MLMVTRTVTINKATSFVLLVHGLKRKDLQDIEVKLPVIYGNVKSKLVTMVMPVEEDGKKVRVHSQCFQSSSIS